MCWLFLPTRQPRISDPQGHHESLLGPFFTIGHSQPVQVNITESIMAEVKGLIIDTPHIDNILSGKKIWEMRSTMTKQRA